MQLITKLYNIFLISELLLFLLSVYFKVNLITNIQFQLINNISYSYILLYIIYNILYIYI